MKKKQILIVEDERIVATDVKMALQNLGYSVCGIVVSGKEAIIKTEETHPDLVLMDIILEGEIDGIEAAETLRARFNVPVVYFTAYADKKTIERAKKTEPFGYIVKPFDDRELLSIIEIALYKHKLENMLKESEEKYRELADSISDVFFAMDKDLRYTYWNKASEKLTGIKAKDALGKSIIEIFPDNEETRRAKKAYQEVLQTKRSQTSINEYSLAGKQYFFEISAYPSKRGLSVFVRDITKRKNIEEALERRSHDLGERVKELSCLYGIEEICRRKNVTIEAVLNFSLQLLPSGWQYPEITGARIVLNGKKYKTRNFKVTKWIQRAEIIVNNKKAGIVEVCYLKERPESDKGPFLKEERKLINAVAERLGQFVEGKKTEDLLKASEAFNFALFQFNPIEIIVVDHAGRVTKTNLARRKSGDRWPNIGDVMYKDYAGKHEIDMHAELMECIMSKKIKRFPELKYNDKYMSVIMAPFPMGAIITSQDITECNRIEQALRESKQLFEKMFISQRDAILLLDSTIPPKILDCNPITTEIFGYTKQEILGCPTSFLHCSKASLKKFQEQLYPAVSKQGFLHLLEFEMRRKDGTVFPTEHSVIPLEDDQGKHIGWVSVVRDITKRKKAEEELGKSREQLQKKKKGLSLLGKCTTSWDSH